MQASRNRIAVASMALAVIASGATACGDNATEETYYKLTGSLQCGASQSTPTQLSALASELAGAGASVSAIRCGNTGGVYPAVCGAGTGEIWLVTTVDTDSSVMLSQGFSAILELPNHTEVPCG